MALHVPKAPGVTSMLKEGVRYFSGLEEAVFRNISACKQFAQSVRTAYGPNGMNKMVINHLEKLFVTSDAATIIKELDVEHPAAKLLVLASEMQEAEVGDGTNFVIILGGSLLAEAEELLRFGITTSEIVEGYEMALEKALEELPKLVVLEAKDFLNNDQIKAAVKSSVMSKQYGKEDFIADLVCKACTSILPGNAVEKTTFNVDNVRVCKILGSGLQASQVVQGMVFKRQVEGDITKVDNAKVAVYTCAVDIMQTETKGTVLIKSAAELMNFSRGEESLLESQVKAIADTGANVVVSGGKFGDMALYFLNKYNLMAVRIPSKFDLRRLCKTVGATALTKLVPPSKEELGMADSVHVEELGDTNVVVFELKGDSRISTVVVRGATDNYMDDIERAIDDGVNTFKAVTRDGRFLPGAGATEIELAARIASFADTLPGLEQYAVRKFSTALEVFPKTLAENSGTQANELLSKLHAAHKEGKINFGFDIESTGVAAIHDAVTAGIIDLYLTKMWGLKYAVNAACTVLKVDQIIMAKRAGGPKPPKAKANSDDES